ncbi:unnamed protein product [Clonostachys rhizophaga]|uniref:Uncharacterized protein n=1 Tax=Clonostachys rhizophaga TaxID=160324 RepID=A0A9N9YMS6_9HYPO|nr:unnamed protein product [Clonostachys rhizophaga]
MATHEHGNSESDLRETLVKKPKISFSQKFTRPFREAWHDLRSMKWQREGLMYLFAIWVHCLIVLVVWLLLLSIGSGVSKENSPCQPDGEFNAIANTFDWWSPKGLFQITLRIGTLSFDSAKAVDIFWNLIVGRGGQAILAIASTRIWIEYLSVSIATKPASYTTVWLLRFYTEPSTLSTLRLARQFCLGRGLASAFKMWFLVIAALFVVAFPTLMSSLAGYTTANQAWVDLGEHGLDSYSQAFPLAFIIHDGNRVGLSENQHVPYDEGARGLLVQSTTYLPRMVTGYASIKAPTEHHDLIGNVTTYVLSYGLSNTAGSAIVKNRNDTSWGTETLQGPPLNITAFYLPPVVFRPNYSKDFWASKSKDDPLFTDKSLMTYSLSNEAFDMATMQKNGTCQPIQNRYQWGFSFLQVFINLILLSLWTIGMALVWIKSHLTLKLNGFAAIYNDWKGLLEFTEVLGGQLKAAKIEYLTIDDKQLEHEIEKLLQGGSVTGLPLPQGFYSLRQGILRQRWLLLALFWGILACSLDILDAFTWYKKAIIITSFAAKCIFAISAAILASVKTSTNLRVLAFLSVCAIFIPFFLFTGGWLVVPGSCLGATLALVSGTTSRSKATLFGVPFIVNYIIAIVLIMYGLGRERTFLDAYYDAENAKNYYDPY